MPDTSHITPFEIGPYDRIFIEGVEMELWLDGKDEKAFQRKGGGGMPLKYSNEMIKKALDDDSLVVERGVLDPRRCHKEGEAVYLQDMCARQQKIVAFKLRWITLLEWKQSELGPIPHDQRRNVMDVMLNEFRKTYHELRKKAHFDPKKRPSYQTSQEPTLKQPCFEQVAEWQRMLKRAGGDARVLRDGRGTGERKSSFTLEEQHIQGRFVWRYLSSTEPNPAYLYRVMRSFTKKLNEQRPADAQLNIGCRSTYYNRLEALPDFAKLAARHGEGKAAAKYNIVIGKDRGNPMDIVEADECRLDLVTMLEAAKVWDQLTTEEQAAFKKAAGRLWFSAAIDHATTCFVGARLHTQAPSIATARATLEMTSRDKTAAARLAGCKSDWDQHGGYRGVRLDAAAWNTSDALLLTITDAGGAKIHPPVKAPWLRATMERIFATLGSLTLQHFSGRTFSNVVKRGDRDPRKEASVDIEMLEKILVRAIVDIYHNHPNTGKLGGMTPRQAWKAGCQSKRPPAPPSAFLRRTLYGLNYTRVITPAGIRFGGFYYQSPAIQKMRREETSVPVHIRIDPQDVYEISVYDGELARPVPARLKALKGLSLWHATALLQELRCIDTEYTERTESQVDEARLWVDEQAELARFKYGISSPILVKKHLDRLEARITRGVEIVEETEFTYEVSQQDWSGSPFTDDVFGLTDEPETDDLDNGKDQTPEAVEEKYGTTAKARKRKGKEVKAPAGKAKAATAVAASTVPVAETKTDPAEPKFSVRYFDEH